jgi:ectoine hydroxylase-related dioxygenase (phytanoyl-CoA dioxygenase family)
MEQDSYLQMRKEKALKDLNEMGYTVLKEVLKADEVKKIRDTLDKIENEKQYPHNIFTDDERLILWNLHLSHPDIFLDKISNPEILSIVKAVLKETTTLMSFGGIRNRSATPRRNVHIDSRVPMQQFEHTFQLLAMYCISDFTVETGSTYLWPMSHRSGLNPKEIAPVGTAFPGGTQAEARAGDVLIFLGQTWHDVAPNTSGQNRWGLLTYYSRWWVKPSFDYTNCGAEVFNRLTDEQKVLFGFTARPPENGKHRWNTVMKIEDLPKSYDEVHDS